MKEGGKEWKGVGSKRRKEKLEWFGEKYANKGWEKRRNIKKGRIEQFFPFNALEYKEN